MEGRRTSGLCLWALFSQRGRRWEGTRINLWLKLIATSCTQLPWANPSLFLNSLVPSYCRWEFLTSLVSDHDLDGGGLWILLIKSPRGLLSFSCSVLVGRATLEASNMTGTGTGVNREGADGKGALAWSLMGCSSKFI